MNSSVSSGTTCNALHHVWMEKLDNEGEWRQFRISQLGGTYKPYSVYLFFCLVAPVFDPLELCRSSLNEKVFNNTCTYHDKQWQNQCKGLSGNLSRKRHACSGEISFFTLDLGVRKSSPNIIHIPKLDFFCAWVAWFPVLLLQLGRGGQMFRAACNPFLVLGSGLTAFSAEGFQCSGGMDQVLDADSRLGRPHFHLALALNAKHMGLLLPRSCLLPLH